MPDDAQHPHHMSSPGDILVVDDEPEILSFMISLLLDEGYTVRTATNGRQALKMLECQPGMLLLDLLMPSMGGVELLHTMQAQGTNHFPIVVMSAGRVNQAALHALGVAEVIQKPFDIDYLLACIERCVDTTMYPVGSPKHCSG